MVTNIQSDQGAVLRGLDKMRIDLPSGDEDVGMGGKVTTTKKRFNISLQIIWKRKRR